jgi:hypothetical protein
LIVAPLKSYCELLSINKYLHLGITVPKEIICTRLAETKMGQAFEDVNSQRTLASALLAQTGECTNDQCDRLFLTRPHKIALLPIPN